MSKNTTVQVTCPDGGDFYVCTEEAVQFVGCCESDPCAAKGLCPDAQLRNATFSKDDYDKIPRMICGSTGKHGLWYTCRDLQTPFMGCCVEKACVAGCPRDSVVPAVLPSDETDREKFLDPSGDTKTSATAEPRNGGLSTGAIAGIAVGAGGVALLILGILIWKFCIVPRKANKQQQPVQNVSSPMHQPTSPPPFVAHTPTDYQTSYMPTPGAVPYSTPSPHEYGKVSPELSYGRPQSMAAISEVSAASPVPCSQLPPPIHMHPVHEIDSSIGPQEMSTGQEDHIVYYQK